MQKWIPALVTTVAVVSGLVGIAAYLWPRATEKTPTTSVRATGDQSIAAGNDVRIGERTVVDKHDFNNDRKQEAARYLNVARNRCQGLADRIAATTAESSLDLTQMQQFYPPELYPTEVVSEQYGEQVYTDIQTRIEDTQKVFQKAIRPLMANSIHALTGTAPRATEKAKQSAAFANDKKAWLDSTNDLCSYLNAVRT